MNTPAQLIQNSASLNRNALSTHHIPLSSHHPLPQGNRKGSCEILCRINFEIDGSSQQLLVQEHQTLQSITISLIQQLNTSHLSTILPSDMHITSQQQKDYLKLIIRDKLADILASNTQRSLQAVKWRNKLKQIIEERNENRSSLTHLTDRSNNQRRDRKVTRYFGCNVYKGQENDWGSTVDEDGMKEKSRRQQHGGITGEGKDKDRMMYDRMKTLERELNGQAQKYQNVRQSRQNDKDKHNLSIKQIISKMHNNQIINQQLSECTFHPSLPSSQPLTQQNTQHSSHHNNSNKSKWPHSDVFQRLYSQAFHKSEKMKEAERKAALREQESLRLFSFIPTINECSKEIVRFKKETYKNMIECSAEDHSYYETRRQEKMDRQKERLLDREREKQPSMQMRKLKDNNLRMRTQCLREPLNQTYYQQTINNNNHIDSINRINTNGININNSKSKQKLRSMASKLQPQILKPATKVTAQATSIKHKIIPSQFSHSIKLNPSSSSRKSPVPSTSTIKLNKQSQKNLTKRSDKILRGNQDPLPLINTNNNYNEPYSQSKMADCHNFKIKTESCAKQDDKQLLKLLNSSQQKQNSMVSEASWLLGTRQRKKKERLNPLQFFQQQEASTNKKTPFQCPNQAREVSKTRTKSYQALRKVASDHAQQHITNSQRKKQSFTVIFNTLKSNEEEQITYLSIFHSKLIPMTIKNILYPMAAEMKELGVGLDREEFIWSIDRIFQTLTVREKEEIWRWSVQLGRHQAIDQS